MPTDKQPSSEVTTRKRWARSLWAGVLSLLSPGIGHIYARAWPFGATVLATSWLVGALLREVTHAAPTPKAIAVLLSVTVSAPLIYIWLAFDAARRKSRRPFPDPAKWFKSAWLAAIAGSTVAGILTVMLPVGWKSFAIPSASMTPTLAVGDWLFVDIRTASMTLTRGDVVVFTHDGQFYIKRLIGFPGDDIALARGIVSLNGIELNQQASTAEPAGDSADVPGVLVKRFIETLPGGRSSAVQRFTSEGGWNNTSHYQVPPGTVFFLGDNRDNSLDSRMPEWGFIPLRNLVGRAGTIYWSRDKRRLLTSIQ